MISLTEAQANTAGIPEERIGHNQSEREPQKGSAHPGGVVRAKMCLTATLGTQ